jgi:hypothetical protein
VGSSTLNEESIIYLLHSTVVLAQDELAQDEKHRAHFETRYRGMCIMLRICVGTQKAKELVDQVDRLVRDLGYTTLEREF